MRLSVPKLDKSTYDRSISIDRHYPQPRWLQIHSTCLWASLETLARMPGKPSSTALLRQFHDSHWCLFFYFSWPCSSLDECHSQIIAHKPRALVVGSLLFEFNNFNPTTAAFNLINVKVIIGHVWSSKQIEIPSSFSSCNFRLVVQTIATDVLHLVESGLPTLQENRVWQRRQVFDLPLRRRRGFHETDD